MAHSEFSNVVIKGIATAVPKGIEYIEKVQSKANSSNKDKFGKEISGMQKRVSLEEQTASDLGFIAAEALIKEMKLDVGEISFLVFVTRTPDYRNPPSAAVLQYRLGLNTDCLAYDVNMGGAGFIYGLQIACSLVECMPIKYGLLIVGDTATKLTDSHNSQYNTFGDSVSAILLEKKLNSNLISIITRSFGAEYNSYILRNGGFRATKHAQNLTINNTKFDLFATSELTSAIEDLLKQSETNLKSYDLIALHQESIEIIKNITSNFRLSEEKIFFNIQSYGNTSGSSIPLLLNDLWGCEIGRNVKVLSAGYGEGFSLGIASFSINTGNVIPIIESDDFFEGGSISREI
jgi:3-oxoacyl-[acyl-carrier-protein] synthase-3